MITPRPIFLAAACAILLAQVGRSADASKHAEYLGGSVRSIPPNCIGSLELDDPTELQFKTGKTTIRVPYSQIKTANFAGHKSGHRTIAHIPLPNMPASGGSTLDLSYRDEHGHVNTMSFRLFGKGLAKAEFTLNERLEADKKSAQSGPRMKLQESWWGDKYWKTNRNKSAWPESEAVGTK